MPYQSDKDQVTVALLSGWESALHNVDSLWQVVQLVPDWENKLQQALADPDRKLATEKRFAPMRRAVTQILSGAAGLPALRAAIEDMKKRH